jgi:hypothetical protein
MGKFPESFASVRLLVRFLSGGFSFGPVFSGSPPAFSGSVAMRFAATTVVCPRGPLVTLSHLLVPLRCKVVRGRTIIRTLGVAR